MKRFELWDLWAGRLAGFEPERESLASFCRAHDLNYQSALKWKRKLNPQGSADKLDFVQVPFPMAPGGDFILRRNGWEILIPSSFADQMLARILAVLKEA